MRGRILRRQRVAGFPEIAALGQDCLAKLPVARHVNREGVTVPLVSQDAKVRAIPRHEGAKKSLQSIQGVADRKINAEVQLDSKHVAVRAHV